MAWITDENGLPITDENGIQIFDENGATGLADGAFYVLTLTVD